MKSFRKHYSNNSSRFFFNSGFKHTIQWLVFTLLTHVATTAGYRKREPFNSYSAWLHVLSDNEASLLLQHCTFSPVSLWHSNLQFIIDFALQFLHSSPTKEVNIIFAFFFFFFAPTQTNYTCTYVCKHRYTAVVATVGGFLFCFLQIRYCLDILLSGVFVIASSKLVRTL